MRNIVFLTVSLALMGLMIYYFFPEDNLSSDIEIDNIVVYKSKRQMSVYSNDELLMIYKISLGRQPIGAKEIVGDRKTPEGVYFINDKNPNSGYHKNLDISYPDKDDIENAKRLGKSARV